jgi:copper transport protein
MRFGRTRWRALLGAALALLVWPAAAFAHAMLEATSPARGADLRHQPSAVVFRFNEPVEGTFGAVRVFNARGERVDAGDAFHPGGSGPRVGVHLKPRLPHGTYTATYRVISADGHPVSSGFVFSIGKPGAAGAPVSKLLGRSKTGPVTDVVFGAAKATEYASIALAIGGMAFLLFLWPGALQQVAGGSERWRLASERFARRLRGLVLAAVLAGALAAALAVVMQGAIGAGISGWSAVTPRTVREVLGTRFGTIWGIAVPAWLVVGGLSLALLGVGTRARAAALEPAQLGATGLALRRSWMAGLIFAPLAFLLLAPSLSGHATTQSPVAAMLPLNLVHVLAMSLWVGGLVVLVAVLPAAARQLERSDRTRLVAAILARFSQLAVVAVIVIMTTGLIQAYIEVRSVPNLFDTAFGRAVLIKFCLLLSLIALGAFNRRRSVPRLRALAESGAPPGRTGLLLRRALRTEVALIAVVLGVTAALSSYAPSIARQTGPYSSTKNLGPLQLQMTVDPARLGRNDIHLDFFRQRDGSPFTGAKEITLTALDRGKNIGPLPERVEGMAPGHYMAPGVVLSAPGKWLLDVTVRVSEFDEYETKIEMPVR